MKYRRFQIAPFTEAQLSTPALGDLGLRILRQSLSAAGFFSGKIHRA
jgi:hypothetical protein